MTSEYLNQPRRTEAEAKAGRMVTLQLSVGELRDQIRCIDIALGVADEDLDSARDDQREGIERRMKGLFLQRDRINTAIQEALNDDR